MIELGNTHVERDFSGVRDVALAYCGLLGVAPGGVFNICSGRAYSLSEVMDMAEAISGHRLGVQFNPAIVRANEVHRLRGSAKRLQYALGAWNPRPLRETLTWTLQAG